MEGLIFLGLILVIFGSLAFVSIPPRNSVRLRFKKKEGIEIPGVCVMTGEPAAELHVLRGFTGSPWHVGKTELGLPFSQNGWTQFSKRYPMSLAFFKGGLNACMKVPLFGAYLAIFCWVPFGGFLAGVVASIDLFLRKKQRIVPIRLSVKDDRITSIHLLGVNQQFLSAFLETNGGESAVVQHQKSLKRYAILRAAVVAAVVLFILTMVILFRETMREVHRKLDTIKANQGGERTFEHERRGRNEPTN
ncbi:MAG: hypothetical protein NTZ78_04450 [Candidatus Aureabacteria bacterium]|nr:hypothetical protein [Candidatus Auribacterota bacterium]